jgi:hypothetical protein
MFIGPMFKQQALSSRLMLRSRVLMLKLLPLAHGLFHPVLA